MSAQQRGKSGGALPQGFDSQEELPSYEEASSSRDAGVGTPEQPQYRDILHPTAPDYASSRQEPPGPAERSQAQHTQHYSSLLPPLGPDDEVSPGIPPNYNKVTSSIPEDFRRWPRPATPPGKEPDHPHSRWGFKGRSWRSKGPPKPEGVPLEEVCDRFGNRRREIKFEGAQFHTHNIYATLQRKRNVFLF